MTFPTNVVNGSTNGITIATPSVGGWWQGVDYVNNTTHSLRWCSCCSMHYSGWHSCVPHHQCAKADHDFMQAKAPHDDVLFCRSCGETKPLKKQRAK